MKTGILYFLIGTAGILLVVSCSKDRGDEPVLTPKRIALTTESARVISNCNDFGIKLFTKTAETEKKNLMLSPLSASTALTMLLNGCGSDTYTQLHGTLGYPAGMTTDKINEAYKSLVGQLLKADPKVQFALANAVFYRNGFIVKPAFLATLRSDYKAAVDALDFGSPSALATINKWASDNTNGKIPKVLDAIDPSAVMFLMNALYFNGKWSYQFDKSGTQLRPFYCDDGSEVNVSTMTGEVGARVVGGNGFNAIEIPYGRTNFTMVIIVPGDSPGSFCKTFTPQVWNQITEGFDEESGFGKVIVFMPKFKFSYEKYLNDQLKSLGMVDAFEPDMADLSGISDQQLYVSFVKQNTFIEVDEKGTEAAAVTTIGIYETSVTPPPRQFVIDKPFIFAIRERTTNTLLFIGQVINPGE